MELNNANIAELLRQVAAAYAIKKLGNVFQIRAYETAADAIEHSTSEIKDLWEEGKLDEVPGIGKALKGYLEELFKNGEVEHFEAVKKNIPEVVFALLNVPGVGPKTAYEISQYGVVSLGDFKEKIKSGELIEKGFSAKIAEKVMQGIEEVSWKSSDKRMLLPYASAQAERILSYLKKSKDVVAADPLGSLRRQVATIGDLDFAACSKNPEKVIEYFVKMPGVGRVVDKGENKAVVILDSGLHVDLLVGFPESYGALLQHFTGSKHHNIKLRNFALDKGFSLSEHGVKNTKTGKIYPTKTEEELYKILKMDTPAPEVREDNGEIEAALAHKLPDLIEFKSMKGDLHLHSSFPIDKPSHGPGANPIEEIVKMAISLGYDYVGISDHSPSPSLGKAGVIKTIEKRTKFIQELKKKTKSIRVLNGLEIDIMPDGSLSVPDEALATLDYCIAGIHSGHRGNSEDLTMRILKALESPYVDIISHPTGRLLNERNSFDADWEKIFEYAARNNKIMEINGYPNRLDLRDDLVRLALKYGVKFTIDTDAHEVSQMKNMPYGVAVARRGWAEGKDIVNSWEWKRFANWFNIRE